MLERWLTLVGRVSPGGSGPEARAVHQDLVARYTAAERRYHDLRHIEACLNLLDGVRRLASSPDAVELAIWFHDAVYDSRRHDNEEASATLADGAMKRIGIDRETAQPVRGLILATRHAQPPVDADAALLVDIDLSILGQPEAVFDEYERGVRFEYAWVPEADFRAGRSKVLQSFLARPRIYCTDHFRGALEAGARANLARSLARLASG